MGREVRRLGGRAALGQQVIDGLAGQAPAIPPARRKQLNRLRDATNPRRLRLDIYDRPDRLWTLPGAAAGVGEDVHALLAAIAQPALALR